MFYVQFSMKYRSFVSLLTVDLLQVYLCKKFEHFSSLCLLNNWAKRNKWTLLSMIDHQCNIGHGSVYVGAFRRPAPDVSVQQSWRLCFLWSLRNRTKRNSWIPYQSSVMIDILVMNHYVSLLSVVHPQMYLWRSV